MKLNKWLVIGIAALGLAMVSNVEAAPLGNFDFTLLSTQTGVNNSSTNVPGTTMPIQSDKDLSIVPTWSAINNVANVNSNAYIGVDFAYGPNGTQWTGTPGKPQLQLTNVLAGSTNSTKAFFISRTNFYGATGVRVDLVGTDANTNATLGEVSGNWVP